jgi:hypothetical protein
VIAAAVAAVANFFADPLESDSHADRVAALEAHTAKIRSDAEARKQAANVAAQAGSNADRAALEAANAKARATRARLGKSLATELRTSIAEPWIEFTSTEPTRALALAIGQAINAVDQKVQAQLGSDLWDRAVYLALIAPFVTLHPSLVNGLAHDGAGVQVQTGARVRVASTPHVNGVDVPALLTVLLAVEAHVSDLVSHASGTAHPTARAEYELALDHADRLDANAALESRRAAEHSATLATLPRNAGPVPGIRNVSATANP